MLLLRRSGQPAAAALHILTAFLTILRLSNALQYVSGSPCESVCNAQAGSIADDTVCLDENYRGETSGQNFQRCVACLLNSTAVDTQNSETDVQWGLFTLRYALSSCMFGFPEQRVSISSPCQVTCAPLNASIGYQLSANATNADPGFGFCSASRFDDATINNCAFCYSFIPQQLFLANFLQALHIVCRQTPTQGQPFFPNAQSIFNETLIAGPTASTSTGGGKGGLHGTALALAIALPVVGGIILLAGGCWGCWIYTRKRRRRMAASGRMSRVHNAHADGTSYSPVTPKQMWGEAEPPREMEKLSPNVEQGKNPSPGNANARFSHHYPPGSALGGHSEQSTPLRSSFQTEDVGPGAGQVQDPNLHEQYFGIADGGEGSSDAGPGLGLYEHDQAQSHAPEHLREEERGHWVQ